MTYQPVSFTAADVEAAMAALGIEPVELTAELLVNDDPIPGYAAAVAKHDALMAPKTSKEWAILFRAKLRAAGIKAGVRVVQHWGSIRIYRLDDGEFTAGEQRAIRIMGVENGFTYAEGLPIPAEQAIPTNPFDFEFWR